MFFSSLVYHLGRDARPFDRILLVLVAHVPLMTSVHHLGSDVRSVARNVLVLVAPVLLIRPDARPLGRDTLDVLELVAPISLWSYCSSPCS